MENLYEDGKGKDKFVHSKRHCQSVGGTQNEHLDLMLKKGVYPYDYMNSWEKMEETQLPPKEAFFSKLSDSGIEDDKYAHAQEVWKTFGCQTLGDYHDLYMKSDVLLLADIFENFRDVCMEYYDLDPAHYFTTPNFAWDAMLKKTKVKLQLLTDYDMHLMVEQGLRGGIAMISHRHAKANNPDIKDYEMELKPSDLKGSICTDGDEVYTHDGMLGKVLGFNKKSERYTVEFKGYDESKEHSYIAYLDANNLYGWAMSQPLPKGDFQWSEERDLDKLFEQYIETPADEEQRQLILERRGEEAVEYGDPNCDETLYKPGCIVMVDLEYPEELHDLHNDYYPLAPEPKKVIYDMLSPYAKKLKEQLNIGDDVCKKLVPNLMSKHKYVLDIRNLDYYVKKEMKVTKVHRVITFSQSPWLKSYIDFNTDKRKVAKNTFEKDFFKLMNNSVFGKTMENLRGRVQMKFATSNANWGDNVRTRAAPHHTPPRPTPHTAAGPAGSRTKKMVGEGKKNIATTLVANVTRHEVSPSRSSSILWHDRSMGNMNNCTS